MVTIEYWGEELTLDEKNVSLDELKIVIDQIYEAREKVLKEVPDAEDNLISETALMLIWNMYDASKYDISDIPDPDALLNITLRIFGSAFKLRIPARYESHYRRVARKYNEVFNLLLTRDNANSERIMQISILNVAKYYYDKNKNNE